MKKPSNTKKPAIRKSQQYEKNFKTTRFLHPKANSIEIAIQNASAAIDADPTLQGTDAAKQYNAIYQRLMARRRGRPSSSTRGGHNQKLQDPVLAAKEGLILLGLYGYSFTKMGKAMDDSTHRL